MKTNTELRTKYKLQIRYDMQRGCMVVDSSLGILANVASYLAGDQFITDWIAKKQANPTPKKRRATKSPRRTCHCPNCNPYNYDEPHGAFYCVASGDFSAFNAGVPLGCFESKIAAQTAINNDRHAAASESRNG